MNKIIKREYGEKGIRTDYYIDNEEIKEWYALMHRESENTYEIILNYNTSEIVDEEISRKTFNTKEEAEEFIMNFFQSKII